MDNFVLIPNNIGLYYYNLKKIKGLTREMRIMGSVYLDLLHYINTNEITLIDLKLVYIETIESLKKRGYDSKSLYKKYLEAKKKYPVYRTKYPVYRSKQYYEDIYEESVILNYVEEILTIIFKVDIPTLTEIEIKKAISKKSIEIRKVLRKSILGIDQMPDNGLKEVIESNVANLIDSSSEMKVIKSFKLDKIKKEVKKHQKTKEKSDRSMEYIKSRLDIVLNDYLNFSKVIFENLDETLNELYGYMRNKTNPAYISSYYEYYVTQIRSAQKEFIAKNQFKYDEINQLKSKLNQAEKTSIDQYEKDTRNRLNYSSYSMSDHPRLNQFKVDLLKYVIDFKNH